MALAVFLGLTCCPAAMAAVVRVDTETTPIEGSSHSTLIYQSAPGEANELTVTSGGNGTFLLRDSGATVTAGDGCARLDNATALCAFPPQSALGNSGEVLIDTADMDDRVQANLSPVVDGPIQIDGGIGADTLQSGGALSGGPGDDTLVGGTSDDTLEGGGGRDVLRAGPGDDRLRGGGGDDVLDGGSGDRDVATYDERRSPILIDLAGGRRQGARDERDKLSHIEEVDGGGGDDVLRGDAHANLLNGLGGDDRLSGRGGADHLDGSNGADTALGGPGNDTLWLDNTRDHASGGPGADLLTATRGGGRLSGGPGADRFRLEAPPTRLHCDGGSDAVSAVRRTGVTLSGTLLDGCERVRLGAGQITSSAVPRRAAGRALRLTLRCDDQIGAPPASCHATITLRLLRPGGTAVALGHRTLDLVEHASRSVRIVPSPSARTALSTTRHPLLDVRVEGTSSIGPQEIAPGHFRDHWRVHLSG
jgi:hypothetical protein